MPKQDPRAQAQDSLSRLQDAMHERFGKDVEAAPRLEQLDFHLATVSMVVDHLYDEAGRPAAGG